VIDNKLYRKTELPGNKPIENNKKSSKQIGCMRSLTF